MGFMSGKKQEKKVVDNTHVVRPSNSFTTPEPVSSPGSFIGKTMNIKADIVSDEDVTIEGRVNGNIEVTKTLTIGKNGNVTADMKASVVRIIGAAKGNIIASDKVEILSEGRYTGNIDSKKLVVAEGAVLNGNINKDQNQDA
jgi:cytoskeletal protein CcmA (bactofilin family)